MRDSRSVKPIEIIGVSNIKITLIELDIILVMKILQKYISFHF